MRLTSLLMACTIFAVQTSGVHVHALQSSDATHAHEATVVHLAQATDHAGDRSKHHDRGTEVSLPDQGILKKDGVDNDLVGLPAVRHAAPTPLLLRSHLTAAARNFPDRRAHAHTRPHLRAPPNTLFV